MHTISAQWAWTPDGLRRDVAVTVEGDRVVGLEHAPGAPAGMLLPGLVNAHAHVELSHLRGRVPGGEGVAEWARLMMAVRGEGDPRAAEAGAREVRDAGAAAIIDVSNGGGTAGAIAEAGLRGVVLVEAIGLDRERWGPVLAGEHPAAPGVAVRPTAHACLSCSPALLAHALRGRVTIHCDEDPDEGRLLGERAGPWAALHDALDERRSGPPWRDVLGRAPTATALLARLDLLGPEIGLVHMVAARGEDLDVVAERGATIVLCPRSNLFVSRALPDVAGMVARGIPLAIGTDSLASVPDLDVLAEAALLARTFPMLPRETWMRALTAGGAHLVGDPGLGRLEPGRRPGLLRVDLPSTEDPLERLFSGIRWDRGWVA